MIKTEGDTSKSLATTIAPSGLGVGSPIEDRAITVNPKAAINIPIPILRVPGLGDAGDLSFGEKL